PFRSSASDVLLTAGKTESFITSSRTYDQTRLYAFSLERSFRRGTGAEKPRDEFPRQAAHTVCLRAAQLSRRRLEPTPISSHAADGRADVAHQCGSRHSEARGCRHRP